MKFAPVRDAHVLLTGATGFVGKVVLAELMRRRLELGIEAVYVLVRPKKGQTPQERFAQTAESPAFRLLPDDWVKRCVVATGELSQAECGLNRNDLKLLREKVTHVVHCAASVEFDLPIAEAAAANISSALNVLTLAKTCGKLKQMVSVSTAYVTPHRHEGGPTAPQFVEEVLAPMVRDPQEVYEAILQGRADEKVLLAETGHPNTYTFTKCITEHLLERHRGDVPLCIVRPSIVSATWQHPFPGWIDSAAAFAGFVLLIGSGHMRVMTGHSAAKLDIVPCDVVSDRVLDAAFGPQIQWGIRHAVAGLANCGGIRESADAIVSFFARYPIDRKPELRYILNPSATFKAHELRLHRLPTRLARTAMQVTGQAKQARRVVKLAEKLKYINEAFPYFTSNTFAFDASQPLQDPLFRKLDYIELCCRGIYRHLYKRDETQMSLAGRKHKDAGALPGQLGDLQFALGQPDGNWAIRTFALAVRKALRQCTSEVTFDRLSFERAVAQTAPGSLHVIVPSHRSYMDFLLCSYLFFARPDLGIAIPHIAAAEEFSKIPILGELFKKTQAFYLRRGQGKIDEELTNHVHGLVGQGQTIQFFIEGARSRSRQFLQPRHGLLRCLQGTGKTFTILPISLTYDRMPEEASLLRELRGHARPDMQLRALLAWSAKMAQGQVNLGRVHIACGDPVVMTPEADARSVAMDVMAELQDKTATTTHHLRAFLHHNRLPGVSEQWLRDALERRGGLVIDSPLDIEDDMDDVSEMCMRYQWLHLFYPEARACGQTIRRCSTTRNTTAFTPRSAKSASWNCVMRDCVACFAQFSNRLPATT